MLIITTYTIRVFLKSSIRHPTGPPAPQTAERNDLPVLKACWLLISQPASSLFGEAATASEPNKARFCKMH